MDETEQRLTELEIAVKKLQSDEFISAGVFRRGLVVVGYWLFGVFSLTAALWVLVTVWGLIVG